MPLDSTRQALKECHRLLAPGGLFRLVVPDLRHLVERYLYAADHLNEPEAVISFCLDSGMGSSAWGPLWSRFRGDRHHVMYDQISLEFLLREAGFLHVRRARLGDSTLDFSQLNLERWSNLTTLASNASLKVCLTSFIF